MKKLLLALSLLGTLALAAPRLDPAEPTLNGRFQVSGSWSELKRGWSTLTLLVTDAEQRAVTGANVAVAYEMIGMPMDPPYRPVVEKGDGVYEKPVFLGMRGPWRFEVAVVAGETSDALTHDLDLR